MPKSSNRSWRQTALSSLVAVSGLVLLGAAGVPRNDQEIVNKLSQGSAGEVQLGQLIQQKAIHPAVKDFGARMVEDHTTLLKDAQQWASQNGVQLKTVPDAEEKSEYQKMSKLSGNALDKEYIRGMLADHRKDVSEVQGFIQKYPNSPATALLRKALPTLKVHLQFAEQVAARIGVPSGQG